MKTRLLIIFAMIVIVPAINGSFAEESSILQTVGQIKWYEQNLHSKIPAYKVTVMDSDMNHNPDELDKFSIKVWSDSDPVGIIISVYETEKNSGVFDSTVFFSEDYSTGQRLHAYDGDAVTAEYEDHVLPSPYTLDEKIRIFDTVTSPNTSIDLNENQNPFIRIEDDSFTKQHLLTGKSMSPNPNDFRESGDSIGILYVYSSLSLVGIIVGFFIIKKWKNRK